MKGHSLYFEAPGKVTVRELAIPSPDPNQVMVQTIVSAISPGTEMLLYRGQLPPDLPLDSSIDALANQTGQYPVQYGYAAVGRVIQSGRDVSPEWRNQLVFAFQPHQSHFVTTPELLWPVPGGMSPETAVFLPNMETAVSFVMDAQPLIGEHVVILGQGVVGLLTTQLLSQFPLKQLTSIDIHAARRQWSIRLGATASYAPDTLPDSLPEADLTLELSGNPQALDQAIAVTGYSGRLLIGSWYGQKRADLNLGGRFHRSHMQLMSSQVSQIHPRWRGRWDKQRRLNEAGRQLKQCQPDQLITHRLPLQQAAAAYQLLDEQPQKTLQIMFTYPDLR